MNDFFKDNDRFTDRHARKTKEEKAAYYALQDLIIRAIKEKDKTFSIVEASKALGIYKPQPKSKVVDKR
jgi:hypothetical protein